MSSIEDGLEAAAESGLGVMRGNVARDFESLQSFALHLAASEAIWRRRRRMALEQAAMLIKKDAREQIGRYQPAVGAYPQWAPLAESTDEEKARLGAPADAPLLRWGDLKRSFRSTLISDEEVIVGSIDPNMDWHEFGTIKMPPRPVLGPALLKNIEQIQRLLGGAILDSVISGQRMGYRFSVAEWGTPLPGNANWHFSDDETGEPFG